MFDAQLGEPFGRRELRVTVALVEQVPEAEVPQPVELRADLAKLPTGNLVVINGLVAARHLEGLGNTKGL
jgi:hypothetical protein